MTLVNFPDDLRPPRIKMYRYIHQAEGFVCYAFRHFKIGTLGRVYFKPYPGGRMKIDAEVTGHPDSPMLENRRQLLMPFLQLTPSEIESIFGAGDDDPPAVLSSDMSMIESKLMVCHQCSQGVALLIWAPNTATPSETDEPNELEDYACLMYPKIAQCNVPAWVVGDSDEIEPDVGLAWILKVWPDHEEPQKTRSTDLNKVLDVLQTTHCQNKIQSRIEKM